MESTTNNNQANYEQACSMPSDATSSNDSYRHARPYSKEYIRQISAAEKRRPYIGIKMVIDWFLALIAAICLTPPLLIVAIISFISDPGPVFFSQTRCGRNGKPFRIIKFRSMKKGVLHAHVSAQTLADEDYKRASNGWQRFLRKTSIDELPQILNILLGQMAFIGPRPLVYNEGSVLKERIDNGSIHCRPGLSGLAQINGRRSVDFASKAKFDGEYYEQMGFFYDAGLWRKTIVTVVTCREAE